MTAASGPPRDTSESGDSPPAGPLAGLVSRHRWLPFVLPMLVYMLSGQLEGLFPSDNAPTHAEQSATGDLSPVAPSTSDTSADDRFGDDRAQASPAQRWYPAIYTLRIVLTLVAMAIAWPTYRMFQFRISPLAIVVGVVGVALWVGLCNLHLEAALWPAVENALPGDWGLNESGQRAAYDPLTELGGGLPLLIGFLAVHFLGLALIVPIIEEFFLRGFLLRFVSDVQWWNLPIGPASAAAWIAVIVYAVLTHPAELVAAIVWFSLVTWLVTRTQNIWDAVTAHAVTNLLLGIWVLASGQWWLW